MPRSFKDTNWGVEQAHNGLVKGESPTSILSTLMDVRDELKLIAVAVLTEFEDSFARSDKGTLGHQWIRTLVNTPGGTGDGITANASIASNEAVFTSAGDNTPVHNYQPCWIPLPVFYGLHNTPTVPAPGLYVEFEFSSAAGAGSGAALRYNHDLINGGSVEGAADFYLMVFNGRIDKVVGGGAQSTIGASTWSQVAGDILRFECMVNPAQTQVTLQTIRNGAILQTVVDSSGTRIMTGGPGILMYSMSANGQTLKIKNFKCGLLSALST